MVSALKKEEPTLISLRHPNYSAFSKDAELWRDVFEGGENFINKYLIKFSKREQPSDFTDRKKVTYSPSFAASAIEDIKNSIYQRMMDISRRGGSSTYMEAINGGSDGVDLIGSSMNHFVGQQVLPELLVMRRVGAYIDMPPVKGRTLLEAKQHRVRPYIYIYKSEDILNWIPDLTTGPSEFRAILLQETYNAIHPVFGFPYEVRTRFRYMYVDADGQIVCKFYNLESQQVDFGGNLSNIEYILDVDRIPFVMFELPHSLLKDVGRAQVALLNMASSDIGYILKANFPFYIEQQDWRASSPFTNATGSAQSNEIINGNDEIVSNRTADQGVSDVAVGTATGRAYGLGLDAPAFIHPSPDPLKASMMKQDQVKAEIRQLINLAITNLTPTKQQSAESKGMDNQGLEAGLSFIGLELEKGERKIAEFWALYEGGKAATVNYPTRYSLKSDGERREEAKEYKEMLPVVPSLTLQKEIAKQLARALVGYKVSREILEKIEKEIDDAPFISADPLIIQKDIEIGLLSKKYGSEIRLYPKDNIELANAEHGDRLKRISESQSKSATPIAGGVVDASGTPIAGGARGVPDLSGNPAIDGSVEKQQSRNIDKNGDLVLPVRGNGK